MLVNNNRASAGEATNCYDVCRAWGREGPSLNWSEFNSVLELEGQMEACAFAFATHVVSRYNRCLVSNLVILFRPDPWHYSVD
jgi:hypothetical protein